jgi:hypothetical protein
VNPEILARLSASGIEAGGEGEFITLSRGLCVAVAHRTGNGWSVGSSGMVTERGLAYLVWKEGRAVLVLKGAEADASPEQIAELRKFSEDWKAALGGV